MLARNDENLSNLINSKLTKISDSPPQEVQQAVSSEPVVKTVDARSSPVNNNVSPATAMFNSLSYLISNGIEIDKNLRQPTFYSWITFSELKCECFVIISELLTNQKVPNWLSQRIAWYYSNKFFQEIIADLSITFDVNDITKIESKLFSREKIVVYLRKSISNIIKEWLNEKSKLHEMNVQSLIFSFSRNENEKRKNVIYHEFGLKNKRRVMEDKVALYENLDILHESFLSNLKLSRISNANGTQSVRLPSALFGVFDGHCGVDCAQYVSSHLPMNIIQHSNFKASIEDEMTMKKIVLDSFKSVNEKFTKKANEESLRSGSTACVCVLTDSGKNQNIYSRLDVAWCGDTQFCLVKNGKIVYITEAHKPNDNIEKERIEKCGGNVSFASGTWRVNSSLAVARSFGDIDYQAFGITSEPDFKSFILDGTEDYVLIGCDGLWETLEQTDLCSFIYDNKNEYENIAELLVRRSKENGSTDNITAVFVLLKDNINKITDPRS